MQVLMRTASSPSLLEDTNQLDALLATEGWQTLMTFTREHARRLFRYYKRGFFSDQRLSSAQRPTTSAPGSGPSRMDEDIPQEVYDQIAAEQAASAGGAGGLGGGIRICPHCTFENDHGGADCEVCGLPL